MNKSPSLTPMTWACLHASLMLSGLAVTTMGGPTVAVAGLAAVSFGTLTYSLRGQWTPAGSYGLANAITAFRLCLVGILLGLSFRPAYAVGVALIVLLLDGVDGWQARRTNSCSAYGDLFDKEVDAFFTLVLCLVLFRSDRFGVWILVPGALRYVFVLYRHERARPDLKERATPWSRAAGAFTLGGLIVSLLPLGDAAIGIAATATAVVIASFAHSFRRL